MALALSAAFFSWPGALAALPCPPRFDEGGQLEPVEFGGVEPDDDDELAEEDEPVSVPPLLAALRLSPPADAARLWDETADRAAAAGRWTC